MSRRRFGICQMSGQCVLNSYINGYGGHTFTSIYFSALHGYGVPYLQAYIAYITGNLVIKGL